MRYYSFLVILLTSLSAYSQRDTIQGDNITVKSNMVGIGGTNVLDTYISPEKYRGMDIRFISMTEKWNPNKKLSYQRMFSINAALPHNRAENCNYLAGMINYSWGLHYNIIVNGQGSTVKQQQLRLQFGALLEGNLGGLYSTRSSNNVGQAKMSINICPSAIVSYDFPLWNRMFTARYEIDAPLFGIMFSPNYGQSYYEIFTEGNSDHNIVLTSLGNAPSMRHFLTLDIPIKSVTLRVGYEGDFQQSNVNGIKSHVWTNSFLIGYVKRFKLTKIR
ncbi:MAG: DUF3316 domain-containing protein [Prevotella sp.]|nr:DUF3316 domain-containing protein [Candidatus Equicola stercoris]